MPSKNSEQFFIIIARCFRPFNRFIPMALEIDEKRKRLLAIAGGLFGVPCLLIFFVLDIRAKNLLDAVMDGGSALFVAVSVWILCHVKRGIWIYRFMILLLSALFVYNSFVGTSGESSLLWLLVYPLIVFFLLGVPEGLFWFGAMFIVNLMTITYPALLDTYSYPMEMKVRFLLAWIIIAFFSLSFELLRWYFHSKLTMQSKELQTALENVKTLCGLLPICSVCKRIRDDSGYWNQLEDYLSRHTNAMLTHGICDDCLKDKYPDVYSKRMKLIKSPTNADETP